MDASNTPKFVVFVVFPSQGPMHRMFRVPVTAIGNEWPALQGMLADAREDYAFNDRNENNTLWIIGTRLGVTRGGTDGPVWEKYELTGDATHGNIVGVLCGAGD